MCPGWPVDSQGLQSSTAPARAPEAPREVFLSARMYSGVQEQLCVLITGPWIYSVIVPQTPLAPVSAKACHKWQSRDALASQSCPRARHGMGTQTEEEGTACRNPWMDEAIQEMLQ